MILFSKLFHDLDELTKTNARLDRLEEYFQTASPEESIWVVWFLSGNRIKRAVKTGELRMFVAERSGLPIWLVEECHDQVGDLAETISLLIENRENERSYTLCDIIETFLLPLKGMETSDRKVLMNKAWDELENSNLLPFHKLLTGGFRMGVSKGNLCKALARVGQVEPAVIAQRLAGNWTPENLSLRQILDPVEGETGFCKPYPFCLAYPLLEKPENLGLSSDWQVEWKWDGIRAQLLTLRGKGMIWSRGDESIGESFPDLLECVKALPEDLCMDGEILAWGTEGLRPFSRLQRRIGRKEPGLSTIKREPVKFQAYDLLRLDGVDWRTRPLSERRECLEKIFANLPSGFPLGMSPLIEKGSWSELEKLRMESRKRGVEGFMLKQKNSPYESGRVKGIWYKWKIDPFLADMVVVSAQLGHGKRSNMYTDYSLAVWNEKKELVTVAKAYSGLTDKEIAEFDRFVRKNITGRFGPVRSIRPEMVFEIAFEGVQNSSRHKAGVALRFPRINRWRRDKKPQDADTLMQIREIADAQDKPEDGGPKMDQSGNLLLF